MGFVVLGLVGAGVEGVVGMGFVVLGLVGAGVEGHRLRISPGRLRKTKNCCRTRTFSECWLDLTLILHHFFLGKILDFMGFSAFCRKNKKKFIS
jgi:hypothetical protein